MSKEKTTEGGSCQCGAIKIAIKTDRLVSYVCHCLECKKQSASAFAISVPLKTAEVTITGKLSVYTRAAHSGAETSCYFCENCGTRIYHQSSNSPERLTLKGGVLECTESLNPVAHLWTKRKADWVELPVSIESYREQPDDLTAWRDGILSKP